MHYLFFKSVNKEVKRCVKSGHAIVEQIMNKTEMRLISNLKANKIRFTEFSESLVTNFKTKLVSKEF